MASFGYHARNGNAYRLVHQLGHPETTIASAEHYLVEAPSTPVVDRVYPGLLVTFDADPRPMRTATHILLRCGGNRLDFVLEIASAATADNDTGHKRL